MARRPCVLLALLLTAAALARADDLDGDVAVLKAARQETTGPALLQFFRQRTPSEEERNRIAKMVANLGADEYAKREQATKELTDLAGRGRALVLAALKSDDLEVRKRARRILNKIGEAGEDQPLVVPAARVLAKHAPAGAAKALLDYLPSCEDRDTADEVARAVGPLVVGKDGKADPAAVSLLDDRLAVRRYAVGSALARFGGADLKASAKKLLDDADRGVRRRVALAFLDAKDKAGVPTLLDLVRSPTSEDGSVAEEALYRLAGDKAPAGPEADTEAAQQAYHRRWEGWWKDNAAALDLSKYEPKEPYLGYTLVCLMTPTKASRGTLLELDAKGRTRWKIEDLNYPIHASVIRNNRVLVCEYYGNCVTERDFKGNVVWTKHVPNQVLSAQRLANGNTVIVVRNAILEVDRAGTEVRSIKRTDIIMAAHRDKDGGFAVLTNNGRCVFLDAGGTEVGGFPLGIVLSGVGYRPHFLPTGNVLMPLQNQNKVVEFDRTGKEVREFRFTRPFAVVRLPNGHHLVAGRSQTHLSELDGTGKEVAQHEMPMRPVFMDRR